MASNAAGHQCPMCTDFAAPTIKLLLGHIGRVHSHSPNFSFTCGLDGCLTTFKSYASLKKHIQRRHKNKVDPIGPAEESTSSILTDDNEQEDADDCDVDDENQDMFKLNSARYVATCGISI